MLRTIILLILTLIALPFFAFSGGVGFTIEQWDAFYTLIKIMCGVALGCFVISELSGNYSQTDKLWSIIPLVYAWYVAVQSGFDLRVTVMAALVSIWGVRLTYNFARRGGYSWIPWEGEEDYRWAVLQKMPHLKGRFRWGLFNFFFISFYQHALILLFTLPILAAWQGAGKPIGILDVLAGVLLLGFVVIETIADQQQYDFQEEKHKRIRRAYYLGEPYETGFCTTGLWAIVRHPNYAAEQAIWLCFYLFSVAATGQWLNWSAVGPILLLLLFLGSSDFSEKITASKYPAYAEYQKRVPRFVPNPFRKK